MTTLWPEPSPPARPPVRLSAHCVSLKLVFFSSLSSHWDDFHSGYFGLHVAFVSLKKV
ncbi:hypothetical protein E2C01_081348 [Portunus trituberculatus]|uniref:Uncharacterized protein n=1 Tax=Portunus trituberculatus TaxID=210409 RepID=A0A5B7J0W4_PORTR|nr:hypothetical protein [Portunus trituberculatus]